MRQADHEFRDLLASIEGIDNELSWAVAPLKPEEYLHNNGSMIGIVQHVAGCKFMYGSAAFRNLGVRWRDVVARLEAIGADWDRTQEYLCESHLYWMESWSGLAEDELASIRKTNWGEDWPAWRIITCMTSHDAYHAGQIILLRTMLSPTSVPPDSMAELTRKNLSDSPSW